MQLVELLHYEHTCNAGISEHLRHDPPLTKYPLSHFVHIDDELHCIQFNIVVDAEHNLHLSSPGVLT